MSNTEPVEHVIEFESPDAYEDTTYWECSCGKAGSGADPEIADRRSDAHIDRERGDTRVDRHRG
jgi:hypothetical protein